MQSLIYSIGQYATKAEVAQLIADEYQHAISYRESNMRVNALGESPKQRFESLILESQTEGRTFAETPANELPPLPVGAIQEPKFWIQQPSPSGIRFNQYREQYVVPTQNTSALPKRTYGNPLDYDVKYTMNRPITNQMRIGGSERYVSESRWNNYKRVRVPSTQPSQMTGDTILRSFMGIDSPHTIRHSGYSIDGVLSNKASLEETHVKEPPYYTQNSKEVVTDRISPISLLEIQSKAMSMSLGGALSNSIYTSTEENIDKLSKGEE